LIIGNARFEVSMDMHTNISEDHAASIFRMKVLQYVGVLPHLYI
jgi:hypothetical protein